VYLIPSSAFIAGVIILMAAAVASQFATGEWRLKAIVIGVAGFSLLSLIGVWRFPQRVTPLDNAPLGARHALCLIMWPWLTLGFGSLFLCMTTSVFLAKERAGNVQLVGLVLFPTAIVIGLAYGAVALWKTRKIWLHRQDELPPR